MRVFWFMMMVAFAGPASAQDFVKCGTPALIEAMRMGKARMTSADLQTTATHSHLSPSGKFRLNYDIAGTHAVPLADANADGIPDYIERAGEYADESWRVLVDSLGFVDPVLPGSPYRIDFVNLGGGIYGETRPLSSTTFIRVHPTFNGFPANDDPDGNQLGSLKVTIAHELKHAIQYATSRWQGETGNPIWVEMDATMTEEVVYPQVNDYVLYTNGSIFANPGTGTPNSYPHASWMLYYHERLGPHFWTGVWNRIRDNWTIPMFDAMRASDPMFAPLFDEHFTANHMWHFAAGTRGNREYGFADRARLRTSLSTPMVTPADMAVTPINPRAARHFQYVPTAADTGEVRLIAHRMRPDLHVGLLLFLKDGTVEERLTVRYGGPYPADIIPGYDLLRTGIRFEDVDTIGIVAVNTGAVSASGRFGIGNAAQLATVRYGDFNSDGVVDARDLTDFSAYLVGKLPLPTTASTVFRSDLNQDGVLSTVDAGHLFRGMFPDDRNALGLGPGASRFADPIVPFTKPFEMGGTGLSCPEGMTLPTSLVPEFIADGDTLRLHLTAPAPDPLGRRDWIGRLTYPDSVLALLSVSTDDRPAGEQYSDVNHEDDETTFLHLRASAGDWTSRVTFTFRVKKPATFRLHFLGGDIAPCWGFQNAHVDLTTDPMTPVGLDSEPELASRIELAAPYPNPFNPKTVGRWRLAVGGQAKLTVYDLLGRPVSVLADGWHAEGTHVFTFDGTNLASGLYLIVLDAGGERHVRRVTLLK
jgi:hypothetical protein